MTNTTPNALALDAGATLVDVFRARVAATPNRIAYRQYLEGVDDWHGYTWSDVAERVRCWRRGLGRLGCRRGDRIAILASNRPDWVAADMAALSLGMVVVALFRNDTPGNAGVLLEDCGARFLVIEQAEQWRDILDAHAPPAIEHVIALNGRGDSDRRMQILGQWLPTPDEAAHDTIGDESISSDDLAVICYTSGTTGQSRGVMLTHGNIVWNVRACQRALPLTQQDLLLSFLPLAHMFERTTSYYNAMLGGAEIAFTRGIPHLAEDLRTIRPTVLIGVPRVFERFYARVEQHLRGAPRWQRLAFHAAVDAGTRITQHRSRLWDHLAHRLLAPVVGRPIREQLGGRLRAAVSGGAALAPHISYAFNALGIPILQGYGLTEAGPVISVNRPEDNDPESVGTLLNDVETRLGPDNELLVRSPGVMRGYWHAPEDTAAALSADGWLNTGDKVSRLEERHVYLVGRIKEVIVMSNGEKASPAVLELALQADPLIDQIMVIGEARPYLAALMVPNPECWARWMAENDYPSSARTIEKLLLKRFAKLLQEQPRHAQIRRVAILDTPWTSDNALLTVTQKPRRRKILKACQAQVDSLYDGHFMPDETAFDYYVNHG